MQYAHRKFNGHGQFNEHNSKDTDRTMGKSSLFELILERIKMVIPPTQTAKPLADFILSIDKVDKIH